MVTLILIAGIFWWSLPAKKAGPDVPVIIYLIDTLRADRLGLYGYTSRATSPVIDDLASKSVVFEQAYAPAPWTVPSVTSLVTSTFPCEHTVLSEKNKLGSHQQTLAERLDRVGYFTVSSYANILVGPVTGLDRGYRISERHEPKELAVSGRSVLAERTERLLDRVTHDRFFLYVHTIEPHDPFRMPTGDILKFGHVSIDKREQYKQAHNDYRYTVGADWRAGRPIGTSDNLEQWGPAMAALEDLRGTIDLLYDASVRWADTNLGDLVARLKRRGVWDKAMFIFLSDHGEAFGEHGGWFHEQSVYEELARVPLMIHFPGGKFGGQRISEPVSLVDIMPTIFDYLGRPELCADCRGTSLMPRIRGTVKKGTGESGVILSMRDDPRLYDPRWAGIRGNKNIVVRDERWKAISNIETHSVELYDLAADPDERFDLSAKEPELTRQFQNRARQWLEACLEDRLNPADDHEIDATTREQLRALGYL